MPETTYKKITKVIVWIAGAVILLYLLYLLSDIIIMLALSILLVLIFAPVVAMLEGRGFNRLTSTLITFALFGFVVYLGLSVVIPKFIFQMDQLIIVASIDFNSSAKSNPLNAFIN